MYVSTNGFFPSTTDLYDGDIDTSFTSSNEADKNPTGSRYYTDGFWFIPAATRRPVFFAFTGRNRNREAYASLFLFAP
jgi:hypothetical protein